MATKAKTTPVKVGCEPEVKTLASRVSSAASSLMLKPKSKEDASIAVGQRATLKAIAKEIKEKKDGILKPMNEAIKRVRELFKGPEEQVEEAISQIDSGLAEYNRKVQEELDAKAQRLEERVEEGEISQTKANRILAKKGDELGAAVIPTRKIKEVKVVDESKVPDRYWVIDMVALRRDALDGIKIPGVVVEEVDQIYNKRG